MNKILTGLIVTSLFSVAITYGAAERFMIQFNPTSATAGEAIDMTVKAVDADNNVVKDYDGDIIIDAEGLTLDQDISFPNDGIYTFMATDQGAKTFSKGLIINKPGTFKISVIDIIDDSVQGSANVEVSAAASQTTQGQINISSPVEGGVEKNPTIHIIGTSTLQNSPLQIFVNGRKVSDNITSANGDFSVYIPNIASGANSLQVKILDINGKEIGASRMVNFISDPSLSASFKSINFLPGKEFIVGTRMTINVETERDVSYAEVVFSGLPVRYPLDKIKDGSFQKQIVLQDVGSFPVSLNLGIAGNITNYPEIDRINVLQNTGEATFPSAPTQSGELLAIKQVKVFKEELQQDQISVSWTYSGAFDSFKVRYGLSEDSLNISLPATGNTLVITGIDPAKTYYLKVFGLDPLNNEIGDPSNVVIVEPLKGSAPICKVSGIFLQTLQVGDSYYLSREAAPGAERYVIYKSNDPTDSIDKMQKVGETSDTKFQYPYNPNAKNEEFAYYAVEAICSDGSALKIDEIRKVKVGPLDSIPVLLGLGFLVYLMVRFYRQQQSR